MKTFNKTTSLWVTALLMVLNLNSVLADDTEVYFGQSKLTPDKTRTNVVIVLDSSGSMGLGVGKKGSLKHKELTQYVPTKIYPGAANAAAGVGNPNLYYLYKKSRSFADHYVYFNSVHKNQLTRECSTLLPFEGNDYQDNVEFFYKANGTRSAMCKDGETKCNGYKSNANGPKVGCNRGTPLLIVNSNMHNFLQSYYRYSVLQTVIKDLIDDDFDINMSLMRFHKSHGAYVIKESVKLSEQINKKALKKSVNKIVFDGSTPLTESLMEAVRYLRGDKVGYGIRKGKRLSVAKSLVGNSRRYKSPIKFACQKSHIILFTDGNPNSDKGEDNTINKLTGSNCTGTGNATSSKNSCLDELAGWIARDEKNTPTKFRDHSKLIGDQDITVHTIALGLDSELLRTTAANGRGMIKTPSTAQQLAEDFKSILNGIKLGSDTFVAPAFTINAYNGLQHREELYFALFKPTVTPRWGGNIKKYKLINAKIKDKNNANAIDDKTGYFTDTALSYWTTPRDYNGDGTTENDGGVIERGGFSSVLAQRKPSRSIYTFTGDSPNNQPLKSELLNINNTNITTDLLTPTGAAVLSATERNKIITWARKGGEGTVPQANYFFMADFIHSRPSVVTYRTTVNKDANGKVTSKKFDDIIYAASNMGFLYAIDADTGDELFSFIPKELLPNLTTYYKNTGGFGDKKYGLDAPMTIWRHDDNNNGSIVNGGTVETNDYVYLYQGMRRGGSNIYAFDVSLKSNPLLMWQIKGTANTVTPSGPFRNLAQTWSVPQRATVKWNCSNKQCEDKNVLFFGGGYDAAYDSISNSPTRTNKGNAIYMVDAKTGKLLWSVGDNAQHTLNLTTMNSSLPADVSLGDVDGDGYMDVLFAVDIRGGLWRMDFADQPTNAANFATGGQIANLGGTNGAPADFRRFYNAPDIAFFARRGSAPMLSISVASGYRAHPVETSIKDYLFVVFDRNALQPPKDNKYTYVDNNARMIQFSDLANTNNTAPLTTTPRYGWQKSFNSPGEKGLSRTITFGTQIVMTTYLPDDSNACTPTSGKGRRYMLDALLGKSVAKKGNAVIPYADLKNGGIPPEPAVIYSTQSKCVSGCGAGETEVLEKYANPMVCVGTECFDDVIDQKIHKMFWREN